MLWLDQEHEDDSIGLSLTELFNQLPPGPDFCGRVMAQVEKIAEKPNPLFSALTIVLLTCVCCGLAVANYLLPRYLELGFWPVAVVKVLSSLFSFLLDGSRFLAFIFSRVLSGQGILSALTVFSLILILSLWQKRRISDV
jgi:hypothetical protein